MSDSRYKTLLANLPAVAAVVNSFQSEAVQRAAFDELMTALNAHKDKRTSARSNGSSRIASVADSSPSEPALLHDLVDGGNIHAAPEDD